jgi:hypothetical protein
MQALMFNNSDPLGCYTDEITGTSWGTHYHHNGGFTDGYGRGAAACWYIFPNEVVCAVAVNSVGGIEATGYSGINELIEQSYDSAWK